MSVSNGSSPTLLTDDERHEYYKLLKETAAEDMAASGMLFSSGENPYEKDWDMDFEWPEECPDSLDAKVVAATIIAGKKDKRSGRIRMSTLKRFQLQGGEIQDMREAAGWSSLKENYSGTPDPFAYGTESALQGIGGAMGQYIPLWPGPVTRQLYWQDYWMMSAKAFEAYNHDPISWRCVHLKAEFSLGRGLENKVTYGSGSKKGQGYDKAQTVWDEFWKRNKMDQRLDLIARDYCWGGEQFLRYFKKGRSLTIRSLDPASIYDLITDPEDIETVFAYHQQFQTAYQLFGPDKPNPSGVPPAPTGPSDPGAVTKYIIRQILPQEIDHYKANSSAYERRGRSDLFPALGWIKRLRDYLTSHVIQADMLSRICWDLEVAGNQPTITALRSQLFPNGRAPRPGTVFAHNTSSKLEAIAPPHTSGASGRGDSILDALVTMVSLSGGVPKDWLGFGMQNTRAGALVATEPAAKSLQELQGTIEGMINDSFTRVMKAAGIFDAELETTFPSIAAEDRKQKLDDLGTMEANGWLSKQTSATLAAKEMDITTYDFDSEQKLIAREFPQVETEDVPGSEADPLTGKKPQRPKQGDGTVRRQVIMATKRQAVKLDVTKSPSNMEDEPPGLLVSTDGDTPAPGSHNGTGQTVPGGGSHDNGVTRGGAPANENPMSSGGRSNIKKDSLNIRASESETVFSLTQTQLDWLLMRERNNRVRRRPDDPEYLETSTRFKALSAENLQQLLSSASDTDVTE